MGLKSTLNQSLAFKTFSKTTSGSDVFGYEMFEDGIKSHREKSQLCFTSWRVEITICDLATYAKP